MKLNIQFFGGRGASQSKPSRVSGVKSITLPSGEKIELDSPLKYTGKDPYITGDIRDKMEVWEAKRRANKIEYSTILDENGNVVCENKGGKNSVRTLTRDRMTPNSYFSHNHPRDEAGVLSGTFSDGDLRNFATYKQITYRATGKEGTYSISKTNNFKAAEFMSYIRQSNSQLSKEYKNSVNQIISEYRNGKLDYKQTISKTNAAFNEWMVKTHNDLLANADKYGYVYSLERNGK